MEDNELIQALYKENIPIKEIAEKFDLLTDEVEAILRLKSYQSGEYLAQKLFFSTSSHFNLCLI